MRVTLTREVTNTVELTPAEALHVTVMYLEEIVLKGFYINDKGRLEFWTSYPHGSGTTEDKGVPTLLQRKAWQFLSILKKSKA